MVTQPSSAAARASWQFQVLGVFDLRRDGEVVDSFGARREEELLGYLAVHAAGARPRDVIAADIWPDEDLSTARKNLSYHLFVLKRRLAAVGLDGAIVEVRKTIGLAPDIAVDVVQFGEWVTAAATATSVVDRVLLLERASMLCGGEVLPGVGAGWLVRHRLRQAAQYRSAMTVLAGAAHEDPALREMIEHASPAEWRKARSVAPDSLPARPALRVLAPPADEAPIDLEALVGFAAEAGAGLSSADWKRWVDEVTPREREIESAIGWALEHGAFAEAYGIATPMWWYWYYSNQLATGWVWLERVLDAPYVPEASVRARALHGCGTLANLDGKPRVACRHLAAAVALWEDVGDAGALARSTGNLAMVHFNLREYPEALRLYERAFAAAERAGDVRIQARMLFNAALAAGRMKECARANALLERQLALMGGPEAGGVDVGRAMIEFAGNAAVMGKFDVAVEYSRRAVEILADLGEDAPLSVALGQLGWVALRRGETDDAIRWMQQSFAAAERSGRLWYRGMALGYLACALEGAGRDKEAASAALRATTILRASLEPAAVDELQTGVSAFKGAISE